MGSLDQNGRPVTAPDRLLAAASAARDFLVDYRDELLDSYCVPGPDGTRDRDTADPIESEHLNEVDALIETLRLAIDAFGHVGVRQPNADIIERTPR